MKIKKEKYQLKQEALRKKRKDTKLSDGRGKEMREGKRERADLERSKKKTEEEEEEDKEKEKGAI